MTFVQNNLPVQKIFDLYQIHIASRLTSKGKTIGISTAIALSLVYIIHDLLLKPPKHLRHIPYQSYFTILGSILRGESLVEYDRRVTVPMISSQESNGIYMKPNGLGWNIFVADPKDAKTILLKTEMFPKIDQPSKERSTVLGRFINGPNLAFVDGHQWKSQRRVANPAFHRSMPVKLFGKLTLTLFDIIEQHDNSTIDFTDLMHRWTLDAIGKAGFGFEFNALKQKDNEWVKTYNIVNHSMKAPLYFLFPSLDRYSSPWLTPNRRVAHQKLDKFLEMIDRVIAVKREQVKKGDSQNDHLEENEKDLLTLMIESEKRGEGKISDEELKSNVCVFFQAGHDTTANALACIAYYLAVDHGIQTKAREEVIRVLGDEPQDILPSLEQTKEFIYINQIMKEALRTNDPAPRSMARYASEDTTLSGVFIPKGSIIAVDIFGLHHSSKVWKNPEVFSPERFSKEGEASTRRPGEGMAWVPFGNGARQCIGMNFSLYEQRVLLAMLLRKYTWELPKDSIHRDGLVSSGVLVIGPVKLDIIFHKRY